MSFRVSAPRARPRHPTRGWWGDTGRGEGGRGSVCSGDRPPPQRETLLRQLQTNQLDMDATLEELSVRQETEEQNYGMCVPGPAARLSGRGCPVGLGGSCVSRSCTHARQNVGGSVGRTRAPGGGAARPCRARGLQPPVSLGQAPLLSMSAAESLE